MITLFWGNNDNAILEIDNSCLENDDHAILENANAF